MVTNSWTATLLDHPKKYEKVYSKYQFIRFLPFCLSFLLAIILLIVYIHTVHCTVQVLYTFYMATICHTFRSFTL